MAWQRGSQASAQGCTRDFRPATSRSLQRCRFSGAHDKRFVTCRDALADIDALVDTAAAGRQSLEEGGASLGTQTEVEGGVEALGPFFRANEGFRGQIRAEVLSAAFSQVRYACRAELLPIGKSGALVSEAAAMSDMSDCAMYFHLRAARARQMVCLAG